MRQRRRARRLLPALLGLLVLATLAPAAEVRGARLLAPMVAGWEQVFRLDWEAAERRGRPVVRGYLVNQSPYTIGRVQLLVDGLDQAGGVIAQGVSWAGAGSLEPFTRMYFEVPAPAPAPRYQVRVFAYDRVERDDPKE